MAMSGTGAVGNPFLVATPTDMNEVKNNLSLHYKQVAHIDLVGFANFGKIGNASIKFTGTFDGNGFEIRNLKMNVGEAEYGLFGNVAGATLKNIRVVGAVITNGVFNWTGGLVGYFNTGSITNCHFNGVINSGGYAVGGLIGHLYAGTISGCSTSGSASGRGELGGMMGTMRVGLVSDCFTTMNILSLEISAGGFFGIISSGMSEFYRCYSSGTVEGSNSTGGFGGTTSTSTIIRDCYCLAPFVKRKAGSVGTGFARFIVDKLSADANFSNNYALSTMEFRT